MKKIILALVMFVTAATSFAQTTPNVKTKEDYLRRSRNQRTAGWIMLGGGIVLVGIGIGGAVAESLNNSNSSGVTAVGVVGELSVLGSIPMFILAGSNKRKAAKLSFDMQKVQIPYAASQVRMVRQPAIAVAISF